MLTKEELDNIAKKFVELKNSEDKKTFEKYQRVCIKKLNQFITCKIKKYRNFSNYEDLRQEAYDALMLSLNNYDPNKGCFAWWANHYVETRVSRQANAHSTIRIPLKKAKLLPPRKTNMPIMIDFNNPSLSIEAEENKEVIKEAIEQLSDIHKQVILTHYGFNDRNPAITAISKDLDVSRPMCVKLLEEAKTALKDKLRNYFE